MTPNPIAIGPGDPGVVSVVIPTYKSEQFLGQTIKSVLDQQVAGLVVECVVVDDGSPGRDAEVAAGFGERLRLVRQANAGVNAARNAGLLVSRGAWVCFLDADDVLLPGALQSRWDVLRNATSSVMVHGPARHIDADGQPISLEWHWPIGDAARGDMLISQLRMGFIVPSAVMIRRDALAAVGGFDPSFTLQASEDFLLFLSLAAHGPFEYVEEPTYLKRVHPGAASMRTVAMELGEFESRWHFFKLRADVRQRLGAKFVSDLMMQKAKVTGARLEKLGRPELAQSIYLRMLLQWPGRWSLYKPLIRATAATLGLRNDTEAPSKR